MTGNAGGASECWGTYDGNDDPNAGFSIDGTTFSFVAKQDMPSTLSGTDIGLTVSGGSSGTWAFNDSYNPTAFLIVLKAANSPGYAAWLFEGSDAASYFGNWQVAWTTGGGPDPSNPDLSHLAIYASGGTPPPNGVPEPGTLGLLGLGLVGIGVARRRKKV